MRETRHLWIGNLADSTREEGIAQHFKRYGKIDKVRFLPKRSGDSGLCACVAFMDIRSAQKAKAAINTLGDRELITDYFDPSTRSASAASDEGQRPSQAQVRPSSSRRYEPHRDSGGDERYSREHPSSYDRNIQSEVAGADSYDSDRSRSRMEGPEKIKSRPYNSKQPDSARKRKTDVVTKEKKKHKKKTEEGKVKGSRVKQKLHKERGRSPTVKHKKSLQSSAASSPVGRKPGKHSSSEGRSSSSGTASRSTSGSRRSSSASSTSSTRSSNSSRTPTSNSQSNSESSYEVEEGPETRKLVAMCIRKLPVRPTVTSLRDGIFHEFKKYGKVKSVLVRGDGPERHALVLFRTAAEANKAVAHAKSKLLFGAAIEASIYEGEVSGQELEECGGIIDEFHPRASRTLFVGNLDKTVGYSDIQNIFVRFGEIVAIEIKKQHNIPQYAFLQYTDIVSVVRAITKMDGEKLGRNTLKLGFGKTVMSSCLWVDGVTDSFTENYLASCFQRYGPVKHVVIDRNRSQALVFYGQYDYAQTAMAKMRARKLNGSRLKMDYASNELIEIFLKHMQSSGQSIQGLENIRQLLQPPSSPTSVPSASSSNYNRTSMSQDSRGSYYDERSQSTYTEDQYATAEGNYRRGWRGRSRERYVYSVEQSSHSRQKRVYDDSYERSDYHRDQSWNHDGYDGNRRTSHYDQDYRQRDYDIRRDQRTYSRKLSRVNAPYDDSYHYRSTRDRSRDERDSERIPERDRVGDRYFSRSGQHLSPSHPRYVSRRSRSVSPRQRDNERYSVERTSGDAVYRRRGRSGSRSPDFHADPIRRRNSIESKSSSHSGTRYTSRTGDVDMREYLDEDKVSIASPHGDERIVEYSEKAKKLRVRKRIMTPESPVREDHVSPKHRLDYGSGSEKEAPSQDRQPIETFEDNTWVSESSPNYSDNNRSRSGTPTRDENQDLIGEVIIKQPLKTSSRSSEKVRNRDETKPSAGSHKEKQKSCDKDYRKGYNQTSESSKTEKPKAHRASSSSLIQRVHSPLEAERKSSLPYTKDFDYRKHAAVRSSKSSGDASNARHKLSKTSSSRLGDERPRRSKTDFDDRVTNSPRSMSPSSEKSRQRSAGSSSLLKREYSPRPDEEDRPHPAKVRKSSDRSKQEVDRHRQAKERGRVSSRDGDQTRDVDERRPYPQKRRHSADLEEDGDNLGMSSKRERKLSSNEYSRHKSSHHHQTSQKHEAPMSIAKQMFLEEEEAESGTESPAVPKPVPDEEIEEIVLSKTDDQDDKPATSSAEHSPTREFANAALVAAQSLLPKRLPKTATKVSDKNPEIVEKKTKVKKDDGNLTELEKEKARLQKLLSKLDKQKQLDVKDAEEVADVVLQELTEKARSKILSSKPAKQPIEQSLQPELLEKTVKEDDCKTEDVKEGEVEHIGFSGDDVTFEEEIVVDTIEEVTEDEVIETEVEEVALKEEEEIEVELEVQDEDEAVPIEEVSSQQEIPTSLEEVVHVPVPVPVTKAEEYDHTQGYRKQMEARKKEMEKLQKKKEHEGKKLLKKQEKEKKKQMKRVQAMRGPSQNVISSVDDDALDTNQDDHDVDITTPDIAGDCDANQSEATQPETILPQDQEAKNDEATSLAEEVEETSEAPQAVISEAKHLQEAKNGEADLKQQLTNPDLDRPWPPDKDKPPRQAPDPTNIDNSGASEQAAEINAADSKNALSTKVVSPITPGSADTSVSSTPLLPGKEPSPKSATVGVTPTGSLTSSVSLKSSLATPTTTPSQTTRTPNFTTPSPASTSSTSSTKSQQRQKQVKNAVGPPPHHRPGQQTHSSRRPSHQGRQDHHSRSRSSHNSDHRKRPNHQQVHRSSSSSSHGSKVKPEGMKRCVAPLSRRPMATITVGLDASPSKPLGKTELEKLRAELESVRNQLDLEMSPSSLSPCSGDEAVIGKSPAQLLSPQSPVLKSPADSAPVRRMESASPALQSGISPSSTPTLTDRLKLLGRVKKRTPSITPEVKADGNNSALIGQQDRDVEFRQSRIFRSSIFDQDSERLSHVCRQLEEDKKVVEKQKLTVVPSVVPLFSGSKFLEPSSFTGTILSSTPIPTLPAVPSACPPPEVVMPADCAAANDQPLLSSISGPKNVLSLSSSELPATAERKQHDFAGKNCNILTSDTPTSETRLPAPPPSADESSMDLSMPDMGENVSSEKKLLTSDDHMESKDQSYQPHSGQLSVTSLSDSGGASGNPKGATNSEIVLEKTSENVDVPLDKPQIEPVIPEPVLDPGHDSGADLLQKTDTNVEIPATTAKPVEQESGSFIGEVVGDIDVFAGTCMEISESHSTVDGTAESALCLLEELDTQIANGNLDSAKSRADGDTSVEKEIVQGEVPVESKEVPITHESAIGDTKVNKTNATEKAKKQTPDAPESDIGAMKVNTPENVTSSDKSEPQPSTQQTVSKGSKLMSAKSESSEAKLKAKATGKIGKKTSDIAKDSKKLKHIGKHKSGQKESKTSGKESSVKKEGMKKQKSDESKKTSEQQPSIESKETKAKPEGDKLTKSKSGSEKSNQKSIEKEKAASSLSQSSKQASSSKSTTSENAGKTSKDDQKDSRVTKPAKSDGSENPADQRNKEGIEHTDSTKSKQSDLQTKEKKSHKEGKKDKKPLAEKKSVPVSDSKHAGKKLKKKSEKSTEEKGSSAQKIETTKEMTKNSQTSDPPKSTTEKLVTSTDVKVSTSQMKGVSHPSKTEVKDAKEGISLTKKKKKKKHSSEKEEVKVSTAVDKKPAKNADESTNPVQDSSSKSSHEVKKGVEKADKPKKSSKHNLEKKQSEIKSQDKEFSKSGSGKGKKDSSKTFPEKTSKKDPLKKVTKGHADLKSSHSVLGKSDQKKEDAVSSTKKVKKSKSAKSSSMSPASRKQSRYSLIYSDSSSENSDDGDASPILSSKPPKQIEDTKPMKKGDVDKPVKSSTKSESVGKSKSKWPDLDDDADKERSFHRHWSTSSSSSMSDSAGPPPVVSSSFLVTETIKNETILREGYTEQGFTDSSEDEVEKKKKEERETKSRTPKPSSQSRPFEKVSEQKSKKKLGKQDPIKSPKKEAQKTSEQSRPSRRIMWSSDSDSSDGDLIISMSCSDISDASDGENKSSINSKVPKLDANLKQKETKSQETLLGLDLTSSSSDEDEAPKVPKIEVPKLKECTQKGKKSSVFKEAKSSSLKEKPSKPAIAASKPNFDSDSSDLDDPVVEKKKKSKSEKELNRDKKKGTEQPQSSHSRKNDVRQKIKESSGRKPEKDKESSASSSDMEVEEKTGPKHTSKVKDSSEILKKKSKPKFSGQQVSKSTLEKTKSDSKALKSSTKSHDRKDKLKSKSYSLDKLPSTGVKAKESSQKEADTKTALGMSTQEKARSSSKDRPKGDKDVPQLKETSKDEKSEMSTTSSTKNHPLHKLKQNKHGNVAGPTNVVTESKSQTRELEVGTQKHPKKTVKEGKRSDKKAQMVEQGKGGKLEKEKVKSSSKQSEPSKPEKHARKKKKKAHKKETKDAEKSIPPKHQEQPEKKLQPLQKLSEKEQKELSRSLFSSDSDDDDFEMVEEAPLIQRPKLAPTLRRTSKDLDSVQNKNRENETSQHSDSPKKDKGNIESSPRKGKKETPRKNTDLDERGGIEMSKASEKRRESGESFLTSTTDESDTEQKLAVQSVISSLEQENDAAKSPEGETAEDKHEDEERAENVEGITPNIKVESIETDAPMLGASKTDSPAKSSDAAERPEKKAKISKTKEGVKQETVGQQSPVLPNPGFQRSKHGLHYGAKGRRENMDKMKSVSHERDEEAVRSIMGILDESSDADSYFSDVRPEESTPMQPPSIGGKTPDRDRSLRRSRDSDVSSGLDRPSTSESRIFDSKTENVSSSKVVDEDVDMKVEVKEERTTAEENELAAAVSSIEGLFGDFGEKRSEYDDFSSSQSRNFTEQQVTASEAVQKNKEADLEPDALSQEEVEKSSEEAALAASTLLAESSEEDGSFYGFLPTPTRNVNKASISTEKEMPENSLTPEASSDAELPSVQDKSVPHPEQRQLPASTSTSDTSTVTQVTSSRKRHRAVRDKGSSGRSSSRDTDWSVSDASTSETEAATHESAGTPGPKPAKQRKIAKSASSTQQTAADDQYEFDADANDSLSLPKSEPTHGNLPFVCTATSPQIQEQSPAPVASAAVPFVNVAASPAPDSTSNSTMSSEQFPSAVQPVQETPPQQPRKLSRDSDSGGNMTGATAKRRPSSSSSSSTAATSPTRGSQISQLTPTVLNKNSQSVGGMQVHGPSGYASHSTPFLPPQSSALPAMPVHVTEHSLTHPFSNSYPMENPIAATYATPSTSQLTQSTPFHSQTTTQQVAPGFHAHLPPQVATMYSARPAHLVSSHPSSLYSQQPALGTTNVSSMPVHTNIKMHSPNTGSQHGPKSNIPMTIPPATLSLPTPASASLMSPTQRQGQFVHHPPSGTLSNPVEFGQSMQYHVGVPTYPHRPMHQASIPTTQPSPKHEPITNQDPGQKSLPMPAFSHPQALPPPTRPLYQPHLYPVPGQISPQALGQPPFALPSPTRPSSSQISPTVTAAPVPSTQVQSGLQRPPSNTFMQQQQQFTQAPPVQQRPVVSPQLKPADAQHNITPQSQPPVEKAEVPHPQSSNPATSNPPQGALPQTMYRKLDPAQPLPGTQHGLPSFVHPSLYYPPGLHGFPGLPPTLSPYLLRPPSSVVHTAQFPEVARQQQHMQIPQRMPSEKPQTQPFPTLPQTPVRKDQNVPPQSSKTSPVPRDTPHSIQGPYGIAQSAPPSHVQTIPQIAPYPAYAASSAAAHHAHPHRAEHGDRVLLAQGEQDPAHMVDQHFRRCLNATPSRSNPAPPAVVSTSTSTDNQRYVGQQRQDHLAPASQHSGLNLQQLRPGMNFPTGFAIGSGMRYPVPAEHHHLWPRPGANFRPPVPGVASQQPSYLPNQVSPHLGPQPGSAEQQMRMPTVPHQPHSTLSQSAEHRPSSSDPGDQVMDLFQRYPVIWQGLLALRTDSAAVQTHFICGDQALARACLPRPDAQSETDKERNLAVLRIVQRMRLEPPQLEGIDKRMMAGSDFCLLLAIPCGRDKNDVNKQQNALKERFIDYLKQKQAAGIVSVQHQQSQSQTQYVLHVFPPCDFTTKHLQLHAQDLLSNINDIQHIMIVIAAV